MALRGKLGFIGGGRMGEALIQGLLKSGIIAAENILATDPVADRRAYLADTYGVNTMTAAGCTCLVRLRHCYTGS